MKYLAILWIVFLFSPLLLSADAPDKAVVTITVSKTDTLVNICKEWLQNPHEWQTISTFNQLKNPHRIYPGQRIKIPAILLKGIPMEGDVTFIKGNVWVSPKGARSKTLLKKGDTVGQNTQIETGKKSAVEITFEDGSTVFLKPDTRVSIKAARQRQPYFIIRKLFMPAGRTIMRIQKSTGGDSRFEIHTPSAVSAARGTQFRVSVDNDETTRTEVMDGMVGVAGIKKEVVLNPGQGTWVEKGKQPNPAQMLLPPPTLEGLRTLYQRLPVDVSLVMPQKAVAAKLIIAKDSGMKDVIQEHMIQNGTPVPNIMLPDGDYYCQTLSINPAGLEGLPLTPERFKVRRHPFPPFVQRPVNGQEFKTKQVKVEWLMVNHAVSYEIHVSKESDFQNLYQNNQGISGTSTIVLLDTYGVYYFRVRAIAGDGFKGLWSDTMSFRFVEPSKALK